MGSSTKACWVALLSGMPIDLKTLARYGAQARIAELQREIDEIRHEFPDVTPGKKGGRRARPASTAADMPAAPQSRKRKPMSAAAKKAVSLRMKKYWAARRQAKK